MTGPAVLLLVLGMGAGLLGVWVLADLVWHRLTRGGWRVR